MADAQSRGPLDPCMECGHVRPLSGWPAVRCRTIQARKVYAPMDENRRIYRDTPHVHRTAKTGKRGGRKREICHGTLWDIVTQQDLPTKAEVIHNG